MCQHVASREIVRGHCRFPSAALHDESENAGGPIYEGATGYDLTGTGIIDTAANDCQTFDSFEGGSAATEVGVCRACWVEAAPVPA